MDAWLMLFYLFFFSTFGTQVEPRSLKVWSFSKIRGPKLPKCGHNVTTGSPTYILRSWEPLRTFSKHFLILIAQNQPMDSTWT